jgi:hypothetical protein
LKKLSVVALLVLVAAVAFAAPQQDKQKQEKKSELNVTGKWAMTMEMSMGTANPSLELKQDGGKVTGSYTGRYGTFPLEGTLKDRTIQFTFQMGAEGQTVTMSFSGEVAADGQSMKGTASLGDMGDASWTAKRQ